MQSTPTHYSNTWNESMARDHVVDLINHTTILKDASVTPLQGVSIHPWYAFSVLPSTGLAGEITYLVGPDTLLSSGQPDDFNRFMAAIPNQTLQPQDFAELFRRMKNLARGHVMLNLEEEYLLKPEQLSADQFFAPQRIEHNPGVEYRFWYWDDAAQAPVLYSVFVAKDGSVSF